MNKVVAAAVVLFAVLAWPIPASAAMIQFKFDGWAGPELRVFVSRSPGLAADRPVVFVMHGMRRNADDYRDQWHELALEHDFLLVVPEFSDEDFPGSDGYALGKRFDRNGKQRPPSQWSYAAIEPLFDDIRKRFSMETDRYAIYGHSAGAQFVHRFLFYVPAARVSRAVAANAGWYMMPDFAVDYPYGLRHSGVGRDSVVRVMAMPLTVLLGESDTDTQDPGLRRAPEAILQGEHRFARGQAWFEAARSWSEREGIVFGWRLETVPGVGHSNTLMAPSAARVLLNKS